MSEPRTLGELLAWVSAEEVSIHGEVGYLEGKADALDIVEQHLRRILYGTDTEPGLAERVHQASDDLYDGSENDSGTSEEDLNLADAAWLDALRSEIAQNVEETP